MLQRSGEALYSRCAGDKPRTCSATICVVISTCTSRCSRSSLLIGAAKRGRANRQRVSVRIVEPRSIRVRSVFIAKGIVGGTFSEIHPLDGQRRGRSSHAKRRGGECKVPASPVRHAGAESVASPVRIV